MLEEGQKKPQSAPAVKIAIAALGNRDVRRSRLVTRNPRGRRKNAGTGDFVLASDRSKTYKPAPNVPG